MFKKLGLYYRAIKHLKPIQIRYRLWYMLRDRFRKITGYSYPLSIPKEGYPLNLIEGCPSSIDCSLPSKTFTFLNQSHTFEGTIDWNIEKYGKLWCYNLNYFDYLHQSNISKEEGLKLVCEFIDSVEDIRWGMEPYPISLRGVNWIKFLSKHDIQNSNIDACLYAQYQVLFDNLEYHLLGNHLLENGCSLLFSAFYFRSQRLWDKAQKIIVCQLDEQILSDGGHFERSVMYHALILNRLLDVYNVLLNNSIFDEQGELQEKIGKKVGLMLGWLEQMLWRDGGIPEVNDFVPEMTPDVSALKSYAKKLGLNAISTNLNESGYRRFSNASMEILIDAGNIGPDYIPGHAHADTLSFLIRIDDRDIITEVGVSTYEKNSRRTKERSTAAHNTVMIEGKEQSEVWGGFRVGQKAHVQGLEESENMIQACHDGYNSIGVIHYRRIAFEGKSVVIEDELESNRKNINGLFFVHFAPGLKVKNNSGNIRAGRIKMSFDSKVSITIDDYQKAVKYNSLIMARRAVVSFTDRLITKIEVV